MPAHFPTVAAVCREEDVSLRIRSQGQGFSVSLRMPVGEREGEALSSMSARPVMSRDRLDSTPYAVYSKSAKDRLSESSKRDRYSTATLSAGTDCVVSTLHCSMLLLHRSFFTAVVAADAAKARVLCVAAGDIVCLAAGSHRMVASLLMKDPAFLASLRKDRLAREKNVELDGNLYLRRTGRIHSLNRTL